uniref:Uncharacterized protein n=1 Tax=Utricularia reniformis TaxID=192314 RepID=A0A1Y0AZM3_9LAMI|nr:hypothetical protein AEK19_MT0306 [Utricularia reniformis]ART30581.1 hypothetical protein AEK19_MT0306 [Utricularia reniformis]
MDEPSILYSPITLLELRAEQAQSIRGRLGPAILTLLMRARGFAKSNVEDDWVG